MAQPEPWSGLGLSIQSLEYRTRDDEQATTITPAAARTEASGAENVVATMRPITEAQFQQQVIQLAQLRGWLVHHTRPARIKVAGVETYRTPIAGHAGFPDLVLARRGRVIYAELKAQAGQLREDQIRWRDAMCPPERQAFCGWFLWRPSDWAQIERVLE